MEIWKDIQGFEGCYQVSNLGRVKSFAWSKERILKPGINSRGYLCVVLHSDGTKCTQTVHRLVLKSFIPNDRNKESINHINGIKTDNRLENLEWATLSENMKHAYDAGLKKVSENHISAAKETLKKYSRDTSRLIIDLQTGVFYSSIKEAAESKGIKYQTLASQINGQNTNRTSLRYA